MSKFFLVLLALLLAFGAGYQWGQQQARLNFYLQKAAQANAVIPWPEPEPTNSQSRQAQRDSDALAIRMGQLQARILRIEVLGQRLVKAVGLDANEFDFNTLPGQGGRYLLQKAVSEHSRQLLDYHTKLSLMEGLLLTQKLMKLIRPDSIPVEKGWISSGYGTRTDPFTGKKTFHSGVDFPGKQGENILAAAAGIVTWAGPQSGYGKVLEISHGNGYVTRYAHASRLLKSLGDRVDKGARVALIGSTGRSTGPHLHFEILRDGNAVNPKQFIKQPQ